MLPYLTPYLLNTTLTLILTINPTLLTLPTPPNPIIPYQPGSGSSGVVKYARRVLNPTLPYP